MLTDGKSLLARFSVILFLSRFGQCRMSQVEVDARVKAIQEDLKNGIEVDREELIHNYGLTMDDYERSLERLNKEEMKRTSTQLPLKIKIAKVENNQKERIFLLMAFMG